MVHHVTDTKPPAEDEGEKERGPEDGDEDVDEDEGEGEEGKKRKKHIAKKYVYTCLQHTCTHMPGTHVLYTCAA